MNICRENGEYETETNTFPRIEFKRENEYRKSIFSDLGYYLDQLNKLSKDYLSNDEIKEIFKTIRKYERAILSLIYYMDSFFDGLLEIQKIFKKMEGPNQKSLKSEFYSNEQRNYVSRVSRSTFSEKTTKEEEISRVTDLLKKICLQKKNMKNPVIFLEIFDKVPFKNDSYAEFINYLGSMVERIDSNQWKEKTASVATALSKYTGVNYSLICRAFKLIDLVTELDFENKYYYGESFSVLEKKIEKDHRTRFDNKTFQKDKSDLKNDHRLNDDLGFKSLWYIERYKNRITQIYNKFSERYLFYVISIAKQYKNSSMSFPDLIQEGNIGLLRAVKKYNYELGYKFITYAFPWIRQGITKAIANQSKTIRIPLHVHQEYNNVKRVKNRLKKELWKDPDLESVSAETGKSEAEIYTLLRMFENNILSLNREIKGSTITKVISFIPNTKVVNPEILLEKETLKDEIYFHLSELPERELKIIEMRFGLKDGDMYTLDEIARKFQVSRERIRQLVERALNKLKENGKERLKPYLDCNYQEAACC